MAAKSKTKRQRHHDEVALKSLQIETPRNDSGTVITTRPTIKAQVDNIDAKLNGLYSLRREDDARTLEQRLEFMESIQKLSNRLAMLEKELGIES